MRANEGSLTSSIILKMNNHVGSLARLSGIVKDEKKAINNLKTPRIKFFIYSVIIATIEQMDIKIYKEKEEG